MPSPSRVIPLVLLLLLTFPHAVLTQEDVTAGGVLGMTTSQQVWSRGGTTGDLRGVLLGAWIRVPTPLPHLSVRAEAAYAQRGAALSAEELQAEGDVTAQVRSHYLSLPLHAELSWRMGPLRAAVFSGPTMEFLVGKAADHNVSQFLGVEESVLVGMGFGVGVTTTLPRGFRAGVEIRGLEGLSPAYTDGPSDIRSRSLELLLRVGVPVKAGSRPDVGVEVHGAPARAPRLPPRS